VSPNSYVPEGPGGDDGSDTGLIIALSIVGVLLIAGGVGFYFWRKKK